MEWRLETAYGDPHHRPTDAEVIRYLAWTTRLRRDMRRRNVA